MTKTLPLTNLKFEHVLIEDIDLSLSQTLEMMVFEGHRPTPFSTGVYQVGTNYPNV